ncbi:MAG: glycosyltransferase family 4 protein [Acidobacteria bacterium]|nr:glycosyltransferase family 4 protein [Acidobacteriota bacterium]
MKIALVSPYDMGKRGGVQDQVAVLARWFNDEGHEAYTVGPGIPTPDMGIADHRSTGGSRSLSLNGSKVPMSLGRHAKDLTLEAISDADVVHVHEPFVPRVATAALVGAVQPVVATFHADPAQWTRRLYSVGSYLARRVISNAKIVTTVSPVSASAIAGFTDYEIIPNAIETGFATSTKTRSQVMFLGRSDRRKGLHVLLEAWPKVHAAHPEATLIINSDSGQTLDGVRYVGRLSEAEKRTLYLQSDIFCAPNTGGESFGVVVADALAAGCAVVASAIPAFVHVAGEAGIFVAPGDVTSLADGLVRVLGDDRLKRAKQVAGPIRAAEFSVVRVGNAYLGVYRMALSL